MSNNPQLQRYSARFRKFGDISVGDKLYFCFENFESTKYDYEVIEVTDKTITCHYADTKQYNSITFNVNQMEQKQSLMYQNGCFVCTSLERLEDYLLSVIHTEKSKLLSLQKNVDNIKNIRENKGQTTLF